MNRSSKRLINLTKIIQQISGKVNIDFRLPDSKSKDFLWHHATHLQKHILFVFNMEIFAFCAL